MVAALLNIQIVPWSGPKPNIPGTKVVQLLAREGQKSKEGACPACLGEGMMRKGVCRKCMGKGVVLLVQALRWEGEVAPEAIRESVRKSRAAGANVQATVHVTEHGGSWLDSGDAQIIAGLKGEAMASFYGRSRCNGEHAHFYVNAALVVTYRHHCGKGNGAVTLVAVGADRAHVRKELLWRFRNLEEDRTQQEATVVKIAVDAVKPDTILQFPLEAAIAAYKKSHMYQCKSAVYCASVGAANKPGALVSAAAASK